MKDLWQFGGAVLVRNYINSYIIADFLTGPFLEPPARFKLNFISFHIVHNQDQIKLL